MYSQDDFPSEGGMITQYGLQNSTCSLAVATQFAMGLKTVGSLVVVRSYALCLKQSFASCCKGAFLQMKGKFNRIIGGCNHAESNTVGFQKTIVKGTMHVDYQQQL